MYSWERIERVIRQNGLLWVEEQVQSEGADALAHSPRHQLHPIPSEAVQEATNEG